MYIDPREHRRRVWRIIGRTLWSEVALPAIILTGGVVGVIGFIELWGHNPWLILSLVGLIMIVWGGMHLWTYAEEQARKELKRECGSEHWRKR